MQYCHHACFDPSPFLPVGPLFSTTVNLCHSNCLICQTNGNKDNKHNFEDTFKRSALAQPIGSAATVNLNWHHRAGHRCLSRRHEAGSATLSVEVLPSADTFVTVAEYLI